ncbi:MAG: 4Fe-4S binding protein [Oscillospiraceae bacterium]|jgi:ferredoxin|nr:4Fe-4S binding protein [Oscillospiraceae bacterium]
MAATISSACVSCGSCAASCPVEAITAGDSQYQVNEATCVNCGSCVGTCPVEAISL